MHHCAWVLLRASAAANKTARLPEATAVTRKFSQRGQLVVNKVEMLLIIMCIHIVASSCDLFFVASYKVIKNNKISGSCRH